MHAASSWPRDSLPLVLMCAIHPLITSGIIWHDMDLYDWLSKFYSHYKAAVVDIDTKFGLTIEMDHRNHQPIKIKLVLYKPLISLKNHLK